MIGDSCTLSSMQMKFDLVKKVPIVKMDGKKCFIDTGYPYGINPVNEGVQRFFGIKGLHVAGMGVFKRYTKFDYPNFEITTSDDLISLEGGEMVPLEVRSNGCLVKMTVGGVEGMRYIDTGAAFSYVHNLSTEFPSAGTVDDCGFSGIPWSVPMRRVLCDFVGHKFEILCGDARDNKEAPKGRAVPAEGVIGYDFFTIVVDWVGGKMTFVEVICK